MNLFLEPAPHEFSGNLIFTSHGLQPYFALDAVVKANDGSRSVEFQHDGIEYDGTLYYQKSGLKPRDHPEFDLETVREFRIRFRAKGQVGQRGGTFHIAPRWPDMETIDPDTANPSTPDIVGINARVDGSNLLYDAYPEILRTAARALDVNPKYFESIHEYSNIFQYELYVRLNRDLSERVIGMNSPLQRIFEHVATDGKFRELREDDRDLRGYHHRVRFDSDGARGLLNHRFGKRIKHYHPEHPRNDPTDPLYHPKVGVSFQKSLNSGGSVPWSERETLHTELDEQLLNLLWWADLPTRADENAYIEDAYFGVQESERSLRICKDPTPEIRRDQEAFVVSGLTGNADLNQSDIETLQTLTDGGKPPEEIAKETGFSTRTIYRVVTRLCEILTLRGGAVGFTSDFIADKVRTTLSEARHAIEADGRKSGDDPFSRWANRYGINVANRREGQLLLRFGRVGDADISSVLREGLLAWLDSGGDRQRWKFAQAEWSDNDRRHVKARLA